ncbi:MAG: hypothetical protein JSU66_08425, partial [Deltaproteobacteria bacterium]
MSGLAHLAIGALALAAALWLGARGWVASPDAAALLLGAAATSLLARIARALPHLALAGPRQSALRGAALQRAGLFGQRGAAAERAGGPRPEELLVRQLLCEGFAVVFALCAGLAAGAGRLLATAAVAALAVALLLRPALASFDAESRFDVEHVSTRESPLCIAGEILRGLKKPAACGEFGTRCTPDHPLGAPMVS